MYICTQVYVYIYTYEYTPASRESSSISNCCTYICIHTYICIYICIWMYTCKSRIELNSRLLFESVDTCEWKIESISTSDGIDAGSVCPCVHPISSWPHRVCDMPHGVRDVYTSDGIDAGSVCPCEHPISSWPHRVCDMPHGVRDMSTSDGIDAGSACSYVHPNRLWPHRVFDMPCCIDYKRIAAVSAYSYRHSLQNSTLSRTQIPRFQIKLNQNLNFNLYREIPRNLSLSIWWVLGCSNFSGKCNIDTHLSDQSQSAINIRPAPGKSEFTVGPYEWWEYDWNFLKYSSHS